MLPGSCSINFSWIDHPRIKQTISNKAKLPKELWRGGSEQVSWRKLRWQELCLIGAQLQPSCYLGRVSSCPPIVGIIKVFFLIYIYQESLKESIFVKSKHSDWHVLEFLYSQETLHTSYQLNSFSPPIRIHTSTQQGLCPRCSLPHSRNLLFGFRTPGNIFSLKNQVLPLHI